jgi:hypothetical protein
VKFLNYDDISNTDNNRHNNCISSAEYLCRFSYDHVNVKAGKWQNDSVDGVTDGKLLTDECRTEEQLDVVWDRRDDSWIQRP